MTTTSVLQSHRDNVASATSWEEFRDAQLHYIDLLIKREDINAAARQVQNEFINNTAELIASKWSVRESRETAKQEGDQQ